MISMHQASTGWAHPAPGGSRMTSRAASLIVVALLFMRSQPVDAQQSFFYLIRQAIMGVTSR